MQPTSRDIKWTLQNKLLDELHEKGEVYFVGGYVRDVLLELPRSDRDILVTGIALDELVEILQKYGFADVVGKSFGVIKFYCDGTEYDFSIPSRRSADGSIPDKDMPVEDDLRERDFSVDAIAYNLRNSEFIDPCGGIADISAGILRVVDSDAFKNDPLRILRLCRISAKLGFDIERGTIEYAKLSIAGLAKIAVERIGEEFAKIMILLKPSDAMECLLAIGALDSLLPELVECVGVTKPGGMHAYDVFGHIMHTLDECPPDKKVRFAALFHDISKPRHRFVEDERAKFYGHQESAARVAKKWLVHFAFSKKFATDVAQLVRLHMFTHAATDKGVRRFCRRCGELIDKLFELRFADAKAQGLGGDIEWEMRYQKRVQKILDAKPPLSITDLAVNGDDVMKILKIEPGPKVGIILKRLLQLVLDVPSMNRREILLEEIKKGGE